MNYQRMVAAGLACAALLTIPLSASAVRKGSGGPKSAGTPALTATVPSKGQGLRFSEIESRVRENNLNVKAAREGLAQAEAMDWSEAINELDEAIDDLDELIDTMSDSSSMNMASAVESMATAMAMTQAAQTEEEMILANQAAAAAIAGSAAQISAQTTIATYSAAQAESLKSSLESMEDQRDDLVKQMRDYPKTIEDTKRMVESTVDQIVSGAESLYLSILSTQLQYASLKDTLTATGNTVKEMELRFDLGQISAQTLLQVRNGFKTLDSTVSGLENTLKTLQSSLQSLLGETPDGNLTLADTPSITASQIGNISYEADLEKAKKARYTLYNAARSVEKAKDEMDTARNDEGSNSYQYKMAEHAYQSAVYQNDATIASFELAFQKLYQAIAPAQSALAVKEADLTYQEQVCATAELKYQQGNISANARQEAVNARQSARRDVEAARLDLFTAWHAYRQAVEKGLTGS